MTGLITGLKRMAVHDGPGLRTTLFLKGCPLRCLWCHNPESISPKPQSAFYAQKCIHCGACVGRCSANRMENDRHVFDADACVGCGHCEPLCPNEAFTFYGRKVTVAEILPQLTEDRIFYETSGGGVTLSGGEPLMQPDFCQALLQALKAQGLHTAIDTCGDAPLPVLKRMLPYTDLFLFDLKAVQSDLHRRLTGRDNERILTNLQFLSAQRHPVEIRIPFIPGCNDGEIEAMGALLAALPTPPQRVKVLPYHPYGGSKYRALGLTYALPELKAPDAESVSAAVETLKRFGLHALSG